MQRGEVGGAEQREEYKKRQQVEEKWKRSSSKVEEAVRENRMFRKKKRGDKQGEMVGID